MIYHSNSYKKVIEMISSTKLKKFPFKVSVLILKDDKPNKITQEYTIQKNTLAQILYETIIDTKVENCIPLIITLEDTTICGLETKGVYILDISNDKFIYLCGIKDDELFFKRIFQIQNEKKYFNASFIIGYICNTSDSEKVSLLFANKIREYLEIHGDLKDELTFLSQKDYIDFRINQEVFQLKLLQWIEKSSNKL